MNRVATANAAPPAAAHDLPREGGDTPAFAVSVVVPTYRRPDMLVRCLHAVLAQDLPDARYEVIVCDDGPDPDTRACVARLAEARENERVVLRYVPVRATQGPAGARNAGWRAAHAPIVAFTDDDTIPDPRWLAAGLAAMAAGPSAVTGAVEVPLASASHPGAAPTDYEVDAAGLARAEFVTANCFVRRAMLARLGGFDERYTSAWREDSDLQFRILDAGGDIARCADARIVHPVRPARWGVSLSQQRKSQFDALLYKCHRARYRERIRARPPWDYYATLGGALAGIAGLVAWRAAAVPGALACGVTGGALWAALTLRFALRRLARTSRAPAHVLEMLWTSVLIPPLSIYWRLYGACKFRVAFL